MSATHAILSVSMRPKSIESGASQSATKNSASWTMISETELRTPPVATAEGRSRPCFWRKRTWIAVSAATGTARFENDIADCSSTLGHTGIRIGTLPRNVMPNATSVMSPRTNASATNHQFASRTGAQNSSGFPIRLNSTATAASAPTAMSRLRGWTRYSWRSSAARSPSAAAVASRSSPSRSSRPLRPPSASWVHPEIDCGCSIGSAARSASRSAPAARGGHRALVADDCGSRGEEVGGVAAACPYRGPRRCPLEPGDDDAPVVHEQVVAVDPAVRDARVLAGRRAAPTRRRARRP